MRVRPTSNVGEVSEAQDARVVEQLMNEWNALRVTEEYRRIRFTSLRDEALARWNARGSHGTTESEFVSFRVSRGDMALREILELEEHSERAFQSCRRAMDDLSSLSEKERRRSLASLRATCHEAQRVAMRYRHSLVTTFQHEVEELLTYIDDRLEAAG